MWIQEDVKGLKFTLFCIILGISDGYLVYHNALREISPQGKVQEGDVSRGSLYSKEVSFIPKKSTQTCILAVMIIFGGGREVSECSFSSIHTIYAVSWFKSVIKKVHRLVSPLFLELPLYWPLLCALWMQSCYIKVCSRCNVSTLLPVRTCLPSFELVSTAYHDLQACRTNMGATG